MHIMQETIVHNFKLCFVTCLCLSVLTLLVRCQEEHPAP